ncbi:hypothetical protein F53441_10731 [Fusarium austroafricanum]|uniref:Uncharacterized protein n=1 Tax=Fusarium austroafricanum TaxID=2364996 RepID=A0A8H4K919_9HYPO|nr:hypothetical protein F53441_10731 [Fusarium austroafricanum]
MSLITFNSELFRQPLAQKTLAAALEFKALYDSDSEAFFLSVSRNGALVLLARDHASTLKVIDLSSQLGVPKSEKVTALAATQAIGLETYMAFSTQTVSGASNLWIVSPFSPTGSGSAWSESLKPGSLLSTSKQHSIHIEKLLLGNTPDESGYPFLAAVVNDPTRATKDVSRVEVDITSNSWNWATDLGFPFNIETMIDYCVGTLPGGSGRKAHGIFGIDETQQKRSLTFAGASGLAMQLRSPMQVNLATIANPQSVTTTLDEDGFTNVLIAGDGVLHIPSQNCTDSVPLGTVETPTFAHESLNGMRRIQVTQTGRDIAIWGINGDDNLVNKTAVLKFNKREGYDEMKGSALPVPLLPNGDKVQSFDAVLNRKTGAQYLYCLKGDGSVSSLSQAGDSKLWSEQQLQVPDPTDTQDVNTYSCHINIKGTTGQPLPGAEVQLSSSSQVKADSQGAMSIVMPAPDLMVPSITVAAPGVTPQTFSPATKAISKLSTFAKAGTLGGVRGQNGKAIFENVDEKSTQAIASISDIFLGGKQPITSNAQYFVANEDHGFLWQFWHGIVSGVEKILNFTYDAGVFIINTVKKAWRFVVETAEQALKALSGLLTLLGDAVEEALTWLAEKLDWEGILDTAAVFNEMFNAGIGMVEEMIEYGADAADGLFADVEAEVAKWHVPPKVPEEFSKLKPHVSEKKDKKNFGDSPIFNWMNNKLEGGETQTKLAYASGGTEATSLTNLLNTLFDECLKPLWDSFKGTLTDLWDDFRKLFDSDSTVSWQDIMKNMGADIALGVVRGIRKAVKGIMAVSHSFVSWIHGMLNKELDIWLITKLYARVTHGQRLTILDLCSLILAIPTNWVFRILYGGRPRDFPALARLLDELRPRDHKSVEQFQRLDVENAAVYSLQPAPRVDMAMFMGTAAMVPNKVSLSTKSLMSNTGHAQDQKPLGGLDAKSVASSPSVGRMRYIWRLGMLIKSAGVIVYTVYDTVTTGLAWPTVGYADSGAVANEFHKSKMMYVAIVLGVGSFPFEKMDRHPLGFSIRVFSWGCTGVMNVFKSVAAGPVKPAMAGLVGVWDLVCYVIALIAEGIDGKTDRILEWTQRIMADAWAIGSAYNAMTKGAEPYGLGATILVGLAMNVEGGVLAKRQFEYFIENGDKEDYYPPSWSTSLNGSLG